MKVLNDISSLKNNLYLEEKTISSVAYENEQEQGVFLKFVTDNFNDIKINSNIKIYPNPTNFSCIIDAPKATSITIFDKG